MAMITGEIEEGSRRKEECQLDSGLKGARPLRREVRETLGARHQVELDLGAARKRKGAEEEVKGAEEVAIGEVSKASGSLRAPLQARNQDLKLLLLQLKRR